jgi:O-antigen/teichoic acid export membrane protein
VGFPWSLVVAWVGAAILVFATSAVLIPPLGAVGAAAALSATYLCLFVAVLALALREARAGGGEGRAT